MSTKDIDWLDELSKSSLPSDALTFSTGSNYGLDGFTFDTPYEQGGEDKFLPQTKGLSGLPEGLVMAEEEEGLTFAEMIDDEDGVTFDENVAGAKEASLVNLDWLDPTQEQDPDRLPDNETTLDSKRQLEEAWGTDRNTDGLQLVPNKDLDVAQYEQSIQEGARSSLPPERVAAIKDLAASALRQAHFGKSLSMIQETLAAYPEQLRGVQAKLKTEYGLMGKVYIQASVFPGIKNGQWAKELKRSCRTARYVITEDETVATKLGMQMVSEVPWKEALEQYRPMFRADGIKLASGNPKEALRRAFATTPETQVTESYKPVVQPVVASKEEAQEVLKAQAESGPVVKTPGEQATEVKRKKALVQIATWVKQGKLSQQDALRLHQARVKPGAMLKAAAELVTASHSTPVYDGMGTTLSAEAQAARRHVWASLGVQEKEVTTALDKKVQGALRQAVKAGLLSTTEVGRIVKLGKNSQETRQILASALQYASQRQGILPAFKAQKATYGDTGALPKPFAQSARQEAPKTSLEKQASAVEAKKQRHVSEALARAAKSGLLTDVELGRVRKLGKSASHTLQILDAALKVALQRRKTEALPEAKIATYGADRHLVPFAQAARQDANPTRVKAGEVQQLLRWAKLKINTGASGQKLDTLLHAKFSAPVLKQASQSLAELREKHEGRAGHLYVDASAYASASGVAGCEVGARQHRASAVRFVLAMPRCASCTLKNANGVCQQYNKKLTSKIPEERVSERERTGKTASMGGVQGNSYNPAEYDLQQETTLELNTLTENKRLDDISFDMGPEL